MNNEKSFHFLYPDYIQIFDYNQPFNYYPCHLWKRKDKWSFSFHKSFHSEDLSAFLSLQEKESAKNLPETLSFTPNLLEFLCDLFDKDLGMQEKVLQDCIIRYDAIVQDKTNHSEEITTILSDFQTVWHQIHPYFTLICRELLRDELISHFHNNYFMHLDKKGEGISITSSLFNSYIKDLIDYITPFIIEILDYDNNGLVIYFETLRRYLLVWIANSRYISEIYLPSPTNDICDSINFLEVSCDFLNRYRDELNVLNDSDRFTICAKIFATDQVRNSYKDFILTNSKVNTRYNEFSHEDTLMRMQLHFQKNKTIDFDQAVSMMVSDKFKANNREEYNCTFQSVVFTALKEMLSNTVIDDDEKAEKKNTFIIKCKYCGQHFIQPRANSLYCSRIVRKYNKPCSEVGPKIKYANNMSLAEKARHKIVNRFSTNIKRAGNNTGRVSTLTRNREIWNKKEEEYSKQLEDGRITSEEYIENIENAYKKICKNT